MPLESFVDDRVRLLTNMLLVLVVGADTVIDRDLALLPALVSLANEAVAFRVCVPVAVEVVVAQLKLTVALAPGPSVTLFV